MYHIDKLFVNDQYQINDKVGLPLKEVLSNIGLNHKIQPNYEKEELFYIEKLLEKYYHCDNLESIKIMCNTAANWWRNELVNPELDNVSLWKLLVGILNLEYYCNNYINSIPIMENFVEQFKSRLLEELLLEKEIDIYYPSDKFDILKLSIISSNLREYNNSYKYMHIEKNKIQVTNGLEKEYIYYSYKSDKVKTK